MIPQRFAESNRVMTPPPGWREEQCFDVHAFADGNQVVTCWRPTPEELMKLNLGEPVWLVIWGGTMPPVCVTADRPFVEPGPAEDEE